VTLRTMKKGCMIVLVVALFLFAACSHLEPSSLPSAPAGATLPESTTEAEYEMKLTIVYDNNDYDQRLETRWGFSCMIEGLAKTILFDTGGDGVTLLGNMRKLEVDPAEVDVVVLSHIHGDHTGGLNSLLEENSDVIVYLPQSFPQSFKDEIRSFGTEVVEISETEELFDGVYTTGELGNGIKEQSLIVVTGKGMVVITGCAHPGIANIVSKSKDTVADKPVYLVVGGFHMSGASTQQIQSVIGELRQLGVKRVAPCHCSGDETRKLFREEYGENYIDAGAGKVIALQ
jgi:7,8-dihydropterin-6-yl-methyl-4-(beta-D-ribofuranosyl)aminobenzene 5'-phosphate synthase